MVDVLARDQAGRLHQVEMQNQVYGAMAKRMFWSHARLLSDQLYRGASYADLRGVSSIWIFGRPLFPVSPALHHRFIARLRPVNPRPQFRTQPQIRMH